MKESGHLNQRMINRISIQTVAFGIIFFCCIHAAVAVMPVAEVVTDNFLDKTKQKTNIFYFHNIVLGFKYV